MGSIMRRILTVQQRQQILQDLISGKRAVIELADETRMLILSDIIASMRKGRQAPFLSSGWSRNHFSYLGMPFLSIIHKLLQMFGSSSSESYRANTESTNTRTILTAIVISLPSRQCHHVRKSVMLQSLSPTCKHFQFYLYFYMLSQACTSRPIFGTTLSGLSLRPQILTK